MTVAEIVVLLDENRDESNLPGMARYGINTEQAYGIAMPVLCQMAKKIGTDHQAALDLYGTAYTRQRYSRHSWMIPPE